jgi:hypothetical protein
MLQSYPWIGHIGIIAAFAWPLRFLAPALNDVDTFITRISAQPSRSGHGEARL